MDLPIGFIYLFILLVFMEVKWTCFAGGWVHGQLKIKKLLIRLKTDRHLKVIICYNDIKQFDIVFFFSATKTTTTTNYVVYSNSCSLSQTMNIFLIGQECVMS